VKKIVLLFGIVSAILGCSVDDSPNFFFDFVAVNNVAEIPEAFVVNQPDTLEVSFFKPTNCHAFDGFNIVTNGNEREITVVTKFIEQDNSCTAIENATSNAALVFNARNAGEVILNFFNGNDADGNPIFLTFNVPIVE